MDRSYIGNKEVLYGCLVRVKLLKYVSIGDDPFTDQYLSFEKLVNRT